MWLADLWASWSSGSFSSWKKEVIGRRLCVGEGLKACRPHPPTHRARPDLGHPWLLVSWGC